MLPLIVLTLGAIWYFRYTWFYIKLYREFGKEYKIGNLIKASVTALYGSICIVGCILVWFS